MPVIRVTKEFAFESAHALWKYDGKCRNIHGHSYKLFITVKGQVIEDSDNVKNGMLIDFGDLKKIANTQIVDVYDHALIVSEDAAQILPEKQIEMFDKVIVTKYQPTCEQMVTHFAAIMKAHLPKGVELFSIKLYETATSFAEWYAQDN